VTGAARFLPALGAALALVLAVVFVPIRDRCWDPRAPGSTHVAVSRGADGCTLHVRSGDVSIDAAECAQLRCEAGLASLAGHGWGLVLSGLTAAVAVGAAMWVRRRRRTSSAAAAP
jgi:hypothetical protein